MTTMKPALNRLILICALASASLAVQLTDILSPLDDALTEKRMEAAPRQAGGDIVFVGIDKRSLDKFGIWPWGRDIHASIIERLNEIEVAEIYLDIEFSASSNPAVDEVLARAIKDSPAVVTLPVLMQEAGPGAKNRPIEASFPIEPLSKHAWLATVNIFADTDGVIRDFPFGHFVSGQSLFSYPAMLSGVTGPVNTKFAIDFSISPHSVPTYSVVDVLEGKLGVEAFRGKKVIVGAHAIELRDSFTVPVHGVVSGALLQILAAETLSQNRALVPINGHLLTAALTLPLLLLAFLRRLRSLRTAFKALAALALLVEAAAFFVQADMARTLPTAGILLLIAGTGAGLLLQELRGLGWSLGRSRLEGSFSQQILRQVFADSTDAILLVDDTDRVIDASGRAREMFGDIADDAPPSLVLPDALRTAIRQSIADARAGRRVSARTRDLALDLAGAPRILEYHIVTSVLPLPPTVARGTIREGCVACITIRDVTERRAAEAGIERGSKFDELTGAMRRAEFLRSLHACPKDDSGKAIVIFAIKLRSFKNVNLTLGREVGDGVLQSVVRRIADCDPRLGSVARLGSDVFAVHSATGLDLHEASVISRILVAAICEPYALERFTARVGVHVGLAFHDELSGVGREVPLNNAEQALDEARKVFGNAIRSFDPASSVRQEKARRIERSLWSALDHDQIFVFYQPQVRLSDLKIIGAEALVRWRHPTMGLVSPGDFIEIAETSGFIEDLGRWVLDKACEDAAGWPDDMTIAVNVSPVQFQRGDVIADTRRALAVSGLPPHRLHLEITESFFVEGSGEIRETLHDLRMMGISLALDDFGSGFSSFGYLANFPLDKVKADQMFVRKRQLGDKNDAILKSIRMLTQELDLTMICEGIETTEQLTFLREIGCEQGQGYLFGRPQSRQDLLQAVETQMREASAHRAGRA